MGIARYGYDVVGTVVAICALLGVIVWLFVDPKTVRLGLSALLGVALLFTLYFFRDPDRTIPQGEGLVLAPADGKVLEVREVHEPEFLNGEAIRVSIFMSPLNVHVNRFPVSGTVRYFRHIPGEYLMAFDEKSSARNERTQIGIEMGESRVLFTQIAGFIARRIVAEVKEGDRAVRGERFGMIKFGSRVDVFVPKGVRIVVRQGDVTVAGETVLAELS